MKDDIYLRQRLEAIEDQLDSRDNEAEGSVCRVVQTTTVETYPTVPLSYFAVNPVSIDGEAKEGQPATFTVDSTRIFAVLNLGSQVPPSGTKLIAVSSGGRWTMQYDGGYG
jgi:hypothetical protein